MAQPRTPRQALRNIEEVVRLEEAELRRRPSSSLVADAVARFAGTPRFLLLHALGILACLAADLGMSPGLAPFAPFPFGLLGGFFSLEGVLLAACVLMKQDRADAHAEERAHLDLQVSLLAEQEATKVIEMLERISASLGIEAEVVDPEARELGEITTVTELADTLHPEKREDGRPA